MKKVVVFSVALAVILSSGSVNAFMHDKLIEQMKEGAKQLEQEIQGGKDQSEQGQQGSPSPNTRPNNQNDLVISEEERDGIKSFIEKSYSTFPGGRFTNEELYYKSKSTSKFFDIRHQITRWLDGEMDSGYRSFEYVKRDGDGRFNKCLSQPNVGICDTIIRNRRNDVKKIREDFAKLQSHFDSVMEEERKIEARKATERAEERREAEKKATQKRKAEEAQKQKESDPQYKLTDKYSGYIVVKKCYEDRKGRVLQYVNASELKQAKRNIKKLETYWVGKGANSDKAWKDAQKSEPVTNLDLMLNLSKPIGYSKDVKAYCGTIQGVLSANASGVGPTETMKKDF